jgi:hypothetical protein
MSTTPLGNDAPVNLFRKITPAELENGVTLYRCFFLMNDHATDDMVDLGLWIGAEEGTGVEVWFAPDKNTKTTPAPRGQAAAQVEEIADEFTEPDITGFQWSRYSDQAAPWAGPTPLSADDCIGLWLKLLIPAGIHRASLEDSHRLGIIVT